MCLKIRTSTCFLHGSRAPNSSAFERNYCRTALLTCLYFAFICSSYTKHTFMVDRRGVKPRLDRCKRSVLSISLPAHKNQFHSPELFASKHLDDQSLNQVLAHYNDLAVHALPQNRTISRRRNLTVVHIVIALKQIVTATILNLAQLSLSSNRHLSIQLTVKNYALPKRCHRRILAPHRGLEPRTYALTVRRSYQLN